MTEEKKSPLDPIMDVGGFALAGLAGMAFWPQIKAVTGVVTAMAKKSALAATLWLQHNFAAAVRWLNGATLIVLIGFFAAASGLLIYLDKADAHLALVPGAWLGALIVGGAASLAMVLMPYLRLRPVKGLTLTELGTIMSWKPDDGDAQLKVIAERIGPTGRLTAYSIIAPLLASVTATVTLFFVACTLDSNPGMRWKYVAAILLMSMALAVLVVHNLRKVLVEATAGLTDLFDGAVELVGNVGIKLFVVTLPVWTSEKYDQLIGKLRVPFDRVATWVRGIHMDPYLACAMLYPVAFAYPHIWVAGVGIPALLGAGLFLDYAKREKGKLDTLESTRSFLKVFGLVVGVLILWRLWTTVFGTDELSQWDRTSLDPFTSWLGGWHDALIAMKWYWGLLFVAIIGILALIVRPTKDETAKGRMLFIKRAVFAVACAVVALIVYGWLASRAPGSPAHAIAQPIESPASRVRNANRAQAVATKPTPVNRPVIVRVVVGDHPDQHARVRTSRRDPCEGLPASFRSSGVGRRSGCR